MCSTIRPLPLSHCFGLFHETDVWKAPTSTFHQSLELPGMVQPVSISRAKSVLNYPPPPSAPLFCLFQRNHVCKAPTSTFHQSLELPRLVQPVSGSKGQKYARLSAPSLCATVLVCSKGTMYAKPQPVPFTRALNCQERSNQFRDPRVKSMLDYPPPRSTPLLWFVSKEPCMQSPNQYLSPEP